MIGCGLLRSCGRALEINRKLLFTVKIEDAWHCNVSSVKFHWNETCYSTCPDPFLPPRSGKGSAKVWLARLIFPHIARIIFASLTIVMKSDAILASLSSQTYKIIVENNTRFDYCFRFATYIPFSAYSLHSVLEGKGSCMSSYKFLVFD